MQLLVRILIFVLMISSVFGVDEKEKVLRYENNSNDDGGYSFAFESSNGIVREETGRVKILNDGKEIMEVKGVYSYLGTDGVKYEVNYIADENGYRVLPKSYTAPNDRHFDLTNRFIPPGALKSLLG